ncbi:MAG: hypothetical protein DI533_11660 [Cereibacter sphaeroides]|uniref:Uncharacterized protein n=1 Tax=Cereibacter sphaeroides TaxID=1063 RepID=A0A2W5S481_CERSP|nr:MAG: hypothetical protein DI533_11660 [Cereibacter sphaeroides]
MIDRRRGIWSGAFAIAVALATPGLAQDVPSTLVTEAQATCIASRADTYIAENRPVYVVVLPPEGSCPAEIDGTGSLADDSTASGAGIGLKEGESSGFIVMTRTQLVCIKERLADLLEPQLDAPGKFRLSLEKCGG